MCTYALNTMYANRSVITNDDPVSLSRKRGGSGDAAVISLSTFG